MVLIGVMLGAFAGLVLLLQAGSFIIKIKAGGGFVLMVEDYKIKVFISSMCGKGKEDYNITRVGLKLLIESMQFATVYLFEGCGAATVAAGQHYEHALQDSDVCIFLIDNHDGVSDGVQKEIDCANKYGIKSLYYFCDKSTKEETPLQKSLMGAKIAKSTTIHSFEEFIKTGAQDLMADILWVYKDYCKGRMEFQEAEASGGHLAVMSDLYFNTSLVVNENLISHLDCCKAYFLKMILDSPNAIENTNGFDGICSKFLPILFENQQLADFDFSLLQEELAKLQEPHYHAVIEIRWQAVQAYFRGDVSTCVERLEAALALAKTNKMPDWIIKDILIDLRNQRNVLAESCNEYLFCDQAQEEIKNSEYPLHYPLLDRFDGNLYEQCIKKQFKEKIKSPNTVTFGDNISSHIELLANIFSIAMFNGSLTHLLILYRRIQFLSFYLCENYADWNFRLLLLKTTIINHDRKEIDGITKTYADILCKMNSADALAVYEFSNNNRLPHQRLVCNLEAFKVVGYFLADDDFQRISREMLDVGKRWLAEEKRFTALGSHLFDMFSELSLRLQPEDLADFCSRVIEKGCVVLYDDVFKLIGSKLDINDLSVASAQRLIDNVISVVGNEQIRKNIRTLGAALYSLRKRNLSLTAQLDGCIAEQMPDFYSGDYLLETTTNEAADLPRFINLYLEKMETRNQTQGVGGRYAGYMDCPYLTIKAILEQSSVLFNADLMDSIFKVGGETLLQVTQTIEAKCEAIELLVFMSKRYPEVIRRNKEVVHNILAGLDAVVKGQAMMSNLANNVLQLSALFLYDCWGENCYLSIIELLPSISEDILAQVKVGRIINEFLKNEQSAEINEKLEVVLLQLAIQWCESSNLEVRWSAVRILFQLLRNRQFVETIGNQLVRLMDSDNVYIKNAILQQIGVMKNKEPAIYDYVLQKASVDTNYVVRKVQAEIMVSNLSEV